MAKTAKGAMHFEGCKTVNKKPRHWYDITRAHLNFEITKGGQIRKSGTSKPVDERWRERLAELGVKSNPLVSKHTPEADFNRMQNQLVEFIFSGDHKTLNQMAFGNQAVDFAQDGTADNSLIQRNHAIEDWATAIYKWMCRKYGENNIVGFDVHLDETTAHIHASIIPVVLRPDKRTGEIHEVVSYKGHFGGLKSEGEQIMKDLHTELYQQVNCHFGLMRGDPVSETGQRHKNKIEMYYKLNEELPELEERASDLQAYISSLEERKADIESQLKQAEKDLHTKTITREMYDRLVASLEKDRAKIESKLKERRLNLMTLENTIEEKRRQMENVKVQTDYAIRTNGEVVRKFRQNTTLMVKCSIFDELLNGFTQLFSHMGRPSASVIEDIDNPYLEDFFDGSLHEVIAKAGGMMVAAVDAATTPMPSGGGGGGSSDDHPKKKDDEDWLQFGRRVAMNAHSRKKAAQKYKPKR